MENCRVIDRGSCVEIAGEDYRMRLVPVNSEIIRCIYSREEIAETKSLIIEEKERPKTPYEVFEEEDCIVLTVAHLSAWVQKQSGTISFKNPKTGQVLLREGKKELTHSEVKKYTTGDEKPVIDRVKTVDGERNFIRNLKEITDHYAYRGRLYFCFQEGEGIYGLGQGEEGIYNYRGHNQYLYQHNMRIPMPMFVSDEGYGMLFDCCSLMTFSDTEEGTYLFFDTIPYLDYYFVAGEKLDNIIGGFRDLTGDAAMLPKWAYGYIQSREQYYTADELAEVIRHYREIEVPIDGVVQDWNTWEPGNWGEKIVDKERFGNLREKMNEIHKMHAHAMVSVWPNMNTGGKNHTELFDAGHMLNDYSTYNAFSEEAREMYWRQAKEELFDGGFDSWWCDSTEPFSGPDWGGEFKREPWERYQLVGGEHKKYLEPEQANAFALMHAKGIYENQRKTTEEMRVLNLTRSGYASGQKYAAMLWSGDTCASFETLQKQMVEGLNVGMSGYPYWTLDIGGFFTVGSKWQNRGCSCSEDPTPKWFWRGRYNEGINDNGYKELYVRWLQMGTFLPMFRSHGTDTPREIWNFGEKGDMFYDTIERFIHLRYQMMPYIYSLAGAICLERATMMRSLIFDYAADFKARGIEDEFMFGKNLLICPVTKPMYYEAENTKLCVEKTRNCYLPKGNGWYDFWTGEYYGGGQEVKMDAPMEQIPVFVKAGSITPMQRGLFYADAKPDTPLEIHIYTGSDAAFTLYEDEGNNYGYESGQYAKILLSYQEQENIFCMGKIEGNYPGMEREKEVALYINGKCQKTFRYQGEELSLPIF